MATLKDIAKMAGVNVSTVSRALSGNDSIRGETKDKILKIARELNYFPNNSNSIYIESNSYTIGIISPEIMSSFYSQLVGSMEKRISSEGYSMIIGFANFVYEEEVRLLNLFAHKAVDGIIYLSFLDARSKSELVKFKEKYDIPVIQVNTDMELDFYDCLTIDDRLGVSMAVEHLLSLGHTDIGYVGDEESRKRRDYFIEGLKKNGMDADPELIRLGSERFEDGGYLRMKELLASGKRPTAVFASYDDIAIGAMRAITESGLRIPEDISIIGYDDIPMSKYLAKPLTTISVPINELGQITTTILFNKVKNKDFEVIQHVVLKPQLIVRETTAQNSKR